MIKSFLIKHWFYSPLIFENHNVKLELITIRDILGVRLLIQLMWMAPDGLKKLRRKNYHLSKKTSMTFWLRNKLKTGLITLISCSFLLFHRQPTVEVRSPSNSKLSLHFGGPNTSASIGSSSRRREKKGKVNLTRSLKHELLVQQHRCWVQCFEQLVRIRPIRQ